MFETIKQSERQRRSPLSRTALLAATAGTLLLFGGIGYGCLWFLSAVGLTNTRIPVEVSYTPYDDGRRLEDLLGGDVPAELVDTGVLE
jgi:hypothetical protein